MKKSIIEAINKDLLSKSKTVAQVVDEYLAIINVKEKDIDALLEIYGDDSIKTQVSKAQDMIDGGKATLLTGVPIIVKDNICVKGEITSAASKILENYRATYDASVIKKLKEAGAILIARANMDEFAMGSSCENSAFKKTKNPKDTTRIPGGSSGGSAAVVAYGGAPISLGSDTGGSIRQPAALCGIVGLKPTYGSVSRYGLIAMGSSLDVIGPFSQTVRDSEILFDIIKGEDTMDATTIKDVEYKNISNKEFKKVIGVPKSFVEKCNDEEIKNNFNSTIEKLKNSGYTIKEIDIKDIEKALAVYYIIMPAEVSSNLARFDGVRYGLHVDAESPIDSIRKSRTKGFGDEPKRRALLGSYVLSSGYYDAYYYKAIKAREALVAEFSRIFKDVDVIATPTSPIEAWKFGEKSDPLTMYLADIFTVPANIVGIPSISVQSGVTKNNLPIGIQFMAPWCLEKYLFTAGMDIEAL